MLHDVWRPNVAMDIAVQRCSMVCTETACCAATAAVKETTACSNAFIEVKYRGVTYISIF